MRRILLTALAVIASVVFAGVAVASNPPHGADIYGVGGGQTAGGFTQFDLSAHMGPAGDFGHVEAKRPSLGSFDIYVDVDCVNAFALFGGEGQAFISGIVRRVTPVPNFLGANVGDRQYFFVDDNGEPGVAPVDAFYFLTFEPPDVPPATCKALTPAIGAPPNVTQGNINIKLG